MFLLLGNGMSNQSIKKYFDSNNINYLIYDDLNMIIDIDYKKIDVIIKSNGIKNNHKVIVNANKKSIPVISDLQFFYSINNENKYTLVTGSNGKTTVVSLLERCLQNTKSIGNNSLPFFDYINDKKYKILEVSSFMLENINYKNNYNINYDYNIITNIYPTHLEHHESFINYIKSKISFLKYLNNKKTIIYNKDDLLLKRIIDTYDLNKISVSLKEQASVYKKNNYLFYKNKKIININKIKLLGNHNLYNIMFTIAIVNNLKKKKINYKRKIYSYLGENYRMQVIYKKDYLIINDSKSTNFYALSVALDSVNDNTILIVGGKIRKDNYHLLTKYLNKIKCVYTYGENNEMFYNYFSNNNIITYKYNTLKEVVNNLPSLNKNDTLLFSPGSISHDQYTDFNDRGKEFNKLIKNKYLF